MSKLILIRHGQSQWNLENRFTGWVDVDLTDKGREEARNAGKKLKAQGIQLSHVFVSPLKRSQETCQLALEEMNQNNLTPMISPEMIERFYGALTGLDKAETAEKYGKDQVHVWRRSYDTPPPALDKSSEWHPSNTPICKHFPFELPDTESLKDVVARVVPFYENVLQPLLAQDNTIAIFAHGNSIRALIKEIRGMTSDEVQGLEIATGVPTILDFDNGQYKAA